MLVRDSFINDHHEHDTRSRGEVSLNPNRLELYTEKQKFVKVQSLLQNSKIYYIS